MRVAVTGGIAEGKSTVMGYLRSLGESTVSADQIAREVFESEEVQSALSERLGLALPLDRDRVRIAISRDIELRRWLNAVTHPKILDQIEVSSAHWFEVPLLFEACLQARFHSIWVVTCGAAEQRSRLVQRLGDDAAARSLIAAQLPTEVKIAFADEIIRTNQSEAAVLEIVRQGVERESSK